MAVEAVGLRERGTDRLPNTEALPSPRHCTLDLIARAVSQCTGQFVSAEGVRHRAVALGLLRLGEEPSPALSCRCASRLLVAGYRLPAYVASASLKTLRAHLRLGRRVLVPLSGLKKDDAGPLLYQLHRLRLRETSGPSVSLADPEAPPSELLHMSLEQFTAAWAGAGELFFVSVRGWEELSRGSRNFFGGVRDLDGSYHWDVAEIATDGQGQIVRC